ncbi:MAG: DnaD domain protein, partial [Eubacteriales bacterium]|nr:DnaD domain protein [Eubacteriales bacterium]
AEAEAMPAALTAAIINCFYDLFGRNPSSEFLKTVEQLGFALDIITAALRKANDARARNPEGYATQILRSWLLNGVPTEYQGAGRQSTSDAPLADWEQDWIEEFRATQAKQKETND